MRDCIVDGCDNKALKGKYTITDERPDGTMPTKRLWFICRPCLQSLSLSSEQPASHLEEVMIARAVERELEK